MKVFNSMWRTATLAASLALAAISAAPASATTAGAPKYIGAAFTQGYLTSDTNAPSVSIVQGYASDIGRTSIATPPAVGTNIFDSGIKANNYFIFDISSLTEPVTSASLNYEYGAIYGTGTYRIFDATPLSLLSELYTPTMSSTDLMNALQKGTPIGSAWFVDNSNYGLLTVNLNSNGIAALNSAISHETQYFSIGGTVSPVAPAPLAGGGVLAALAAAIALLVTRGGGFLGGLPGVRKLGTA